MSERTITCGERLTLMAYLAAPLLAMTVSVYCEEGGASSGMSAMRFLTALTVVMCVMLCTRRAGGMSCWLKRPVKAFAVVFTSWAVLTFTFPDGVWIFTLYLSMTVWMAMMVCYLGEMVSR